jgi:hypothetical protein
MSSRVYSGWITIWKGIKSFCLTTVSALLGVILEFAVRSLVDWLSDPGHLSQALSGFPPGVGLALTPLITAAIRMLDNWIKNRFR